MEEAKKYLIQCAKVNGKNEYISKLDSEVKLMLLVCKINIYSYIRFRVAFQIRLLLHWKKHQDVDVC